MHSPVTVGAGPSGMGVPVSMAAPVGYAPMPGAAYGFSVTPLSSPEVGKGSSPGKVETLLVAFFTSVHRSLISIVNDLPVSPTLFFLDLSSLLALFRLLHLRLQFAGRG